MKTRTKKTSQTNNPVTPATRDPKEEATTVAAVPRPPIDVSIVEGDTSTFAGCCAFMRKKLAGIETQFFQDIIEIADLLVIAKKHYEAETGTGHGKRNPTRVSSFAKSVAAEIGRSEKFVERLMAPSDIDADTRSLMLETEFSGSRAMVLQLAKKKNAEKRQQAVVAFKERGHAGFVDALGNGKNREANIDQKLKAGGESGRTIGATPQSVGKSSNACAKTSSGPESQVQQEPLDPTTVVRQLLASHVAAAQTLERKLPELSKAMIFLLCLEADGDLDNCTRDAIEQNQRYGRLNALRRASTGASSAGDAIRALNRDIEALSDDMVFTSEEDVAALEERHREVFPAPAPAPAPASATVLTPNATDAILALVGIGPTTKA